MKPDALVVGSGPNGLVAAAHLARAGLRVLVVEAQPRVGGALGSDERTGAGHVSDVGAAFFPFGPVSPALRPLALEEAGVAWLHAPIDSAHPAPDGTCGALARDPERARRALGVGAERWLGLVDWHARNQDRMLEALLGPLPGLRAMLRFGPLNLLRLARVAASSGRRLAERLFRDEAARRVIPGLALHTDVGPDDPFGATVGFMLALLASTAGFAFPRGGAQRITDALVRRIEERGGALRTGARVTSILTRGGRAAGVRLAGGEELEAPLVLADVSAPALYLRLLPEAVVPGRLRSAMRAFRRGFPTFKVDWALSGPVPWTSPDAADAAVVHAGDSLDDLGRFTADVRAGRIPERPYLVIGQQSRFDPTRAPAGRHVLYAYSRAPEGVDWVREKERFADAIDARIEALAPGFRALVVSRVISAPPDLEAANENLEGGDLGGGSARITSQLVFRPAFPWFRYRTPVRGLYLASSYAHPGPGVHGACGWNAARAALDDA